MGFRRDWLALSKRIALCCLILSAPVSCRGEDKSRPMNAPGSLDSIQLVLENARGERIRVRAEVARTDAERSLGLMNRTKLPDGEGMLFIFDFDQRLHFWMKDTYIPLSIAYIGSDGRIIDIFDMNPLDLSGIPSSRPARYALEVPQGWFSRVRVQPGDVLHLPRE